MHVHYQPERIVYKPEDPAKVNNLFNFIFGFKLENGNIEPDTELGLTYVPLKLFDLRLFENKILSIAYETQDEVMYGQNFDEPIPKDGINSIAWRQVHSNEILLEARALPNFGQLTAPFVLGKTLDKSTLKLMNTNTFERYPLVQVKQDNPEDCIGYFFTQQVSDPVRGLVKLIVHFKSIRYFTETRSVQVAYNQVSLDSDVLTFLKN